MGCDRKARKRGAEDVENLGKLPLRPPLPWGASKRSTGGLPATRRDEREEECGTGRAEHTHNSYNTA